MKKLKKGHAIELDKYSSIFCQRIDRDILDKMYFELIVE